MLAIRNLNVHYGGIHALRGVNMHIEQGKIISLIGANGAGKSTTLRSIMGLVPKSDGKVIYKGEDITTTPTIKIVKGGISLTPEGRKVFPDLTVKENLLLGAYLRKNKAEIQKDLEWVYELFPRLLEREWQIAATLSGGEQQMLAVGRSLMSRPQLLMMDEPSLGLAPIIVKDIFDIIKQINEAGVSVLLIEQNAKAALEISDYAYVLETGTVVLEGPGKELITNDEVKKAYLGA